MLSFTYQGRSPRVVFEPGAVRHLARELDLLGVRNACLLATPGRQKQAAAIAADLAERCAGIYAHAVQHVPRDIANEAVAAMRALDADCLVSIGGGSTTGLAKAIALETGLPIVAIPTNYAGSEMTTVYGITEGGLKRTGRDERVLPRAVIYDPELTLGLPYAQSVTSGLNAIAHAAEALYAPDGHPFIHALAGQGIAALAQGLRGLRGNPGDVEGRSQCLYGAWLCGMVLGQVQMGLHHKLCHTLGGMFGLPHAETHTIILPHALAYNAPAAPEAMQAIARALGSAGEGAAPAMLWNLEQELGAPLALRDLGLTASDLDRAAAQAVAQPYPNPRPLDLAAIRDLLQRAWEGRRPD